MKSRKNKFIYFFIAIFCVVAGGIFLSINLYKSYINREAINSYNYWKQHYVVQVSENISRVVNPQDNNITVSEGIGYGMLLSAAADDQTTFNKLWNYGKSYLNVNGLMDWKIDSNGNVIGKGSASDADQDIAFALLIASKKWPQINYLDDAKKMINAIAKCEINSNYVLLPGDSWGKNSPLNPSYIAPAYYSEFGAVTEKGYWQKVSLINTQLLNKIANDKTGLLPDWINENGTVIEKNNIFGYDAIRVPIRLIQFYKENKNSIAEDILQKQYNMFSKIDINDLAAGYTVLGKRLVSYNNSCYLASFTAISYLHPYSKVSIDLVNKLIKDEPKDYYGCSLKAWTLFIIANKL